VPCVTGMAGACRNRTYRALFRAQTVLKVSTALVQAYTHRHTRHNHQQFPRFSICALRHLYHCVSTRPGHTKGIRHFASGARRRAAVLPAVDRIDPNQFRWPCGTRKARRSAGWWRCMPPLRPAPHGSRGEASCAPRVASRCFAKALKPALRRSLSTLSKPQYWCVFLLRRSSPLLYEHLSGYRGGL